MTKSQPLPYDCGVSMLDICITSKIFRNGCTFSFLPYASVTYTMGVAEAPIRADALRYVKVEEENDLLSDTTLP